MEISLILPIYNQKSSVVCTLESIRHVYYPSNSFEVILIDDSSDELLDDLVKKYQSYYRIKYMRHQQNLGRAAARNSGAAIAEGDILVFSDGDRLIMPDFLNEHKRYLKKDTVCIGLALDLFKKPPDGDITEFVLAAINGASNIEKYLYNYNYQEIAFEIYSNNKTSSKISWITLLSGNFSIGKEMFHLLGGFDETFRCWGLENIEFGYRLYKLGCSFLYNPNAINYHLYHTSNRSPALLSEGIEYFYGKHMDENIRKYYNFLKGEIPLSTLDDSMSAVYYNSLRIGSKYKTQ